MRSNKLDDDESLARQLQDEEMLDNYYKWKSKILQESADSILAKLFSARECGAPSEHISQLENEYRLALEQVQKASNNITSDSYAFMQFILHQKQTPTSTAAYRAQPLQSFTEKEKKLIAAHYEKIPQELKKLLDAALADDRIALDMIANPVFLRGEGHVYDLVTVERDILGGKEEASYPHNPGKKFTRNDIIPCNVLIRAMQLLLNIIDGKEYIVPPVVANGVFHKDKAARKRVSPELIQMIEAYYQAGLLPKHRALFDVMCRDSVTNIIMDDPVFLPDGYVYDRSTALLLLESAQLEGLDEVQCPRDEKITFKKEDITDCFLAISILEQFKSIIMAKQALKEDPTPEKVNSLTKG